MTPCEQYKADLLKMIDGELEPQAKKTLAEHLEACSVCNEFVKELLQLKTHLKSLPSVKTSDGFQLLLRERIRREMKGQYKRRETWKTYWAPAFAFGVVVIVSGFVLTQRDTAGSSVVPQSTITQSMPPQRAAYDQVDYVIDTDTQAMTQEEQTQSGNQLAVTDSLLRERTLQNIQARITPVNF